MLRIPSTSMQISAVSRCSSIACSARIAPNETTSKKANFNFDSVDTTGFFDEAAETIGDRYELLSGPLERIRFAYRKGYSWINVELGKYDSEQARHINDCLRRLYGQTFFTRYCYDKKTKRLGLGIQPAQAVRRFFEGGWLEWYAFITSLTLCVDRNLAFSCARGVQVGFRDDELRELDVVFLIDGRIPVVIECKSGEFRDGIEKCVKLRRRLGIEKSQ